MTPAERVARRVIDAVPVLVGAALVAEVVWAFARRLRYPFDLEWMEGGMLAHAWRLRQGLPLYSEPGPDWIPYIYPPGYAALVAASGFELGYPLGRAISLGGTGVCALVLWWIGARRGSHVAGLVAAACFIGCFRASGAFYDLVRPDALAMALLALTLGVVGHAVDRHRVRWAAVAAGVLLAVGFTVKHHLAFFGLPIVAALWVRDGWRPAAAFGFAAAIPAGVFTLVMQWATEGRFLTYLVDVPASHPIDWLRVVPGVPGEIGAWLLPSMLLGIVWLSMRLRAVLIGSSWVALPVMGAVVFGAVAVKVPEVRGVGLPPWPVLIASCASIGAGLGLAMAGGLLGRSQLRALPVGPVLIGGAAVTVAMWMRGHYGGFLNVLMPAHFVICAGLAMVVADVRERWGNRAVHFGTALFLVVQLAVIERQLDLEAVIPTGADVAASEEVVERLTACAPGPILAPYAAWLPVYAGRPPSPHLIALWDLDHEGGPWTDGPARFARAAAKTHWSCVLTGTGKSLGLGIDQHYRLDTQFRHPQGVMAPKTGWRVRPAAVWVPK